MTDCNASIPLLSAIICMGLCRMARRGLDLKSRIREKMKVDTTRDCESGNEKHIWTQPRKTRIYNKIRAVSWREAKQWNGLFKQRHGCIMVCLWSCKHAAAVVLMAVARRCFGVHKGSPSGSLSGGVLPWMMSCSIIPLHVFLLQVFFFFLLS